MSEFKKTRFVFPSLVNPHTRFVLNTGYNDNSHLFVRLATVPLGFSFLKFDTMGDGETQHSNDSAIADPADMADYLLSLATYLDQNFESLDSGERGRIGYTLVMEAKVPDEETIRWALGVEYDEKKTRYASSRDLETSTKAALKYDKRWFEIEKEFDGTPMGAVRLLQTREKVRSELSYYHRRFIFEQLLTLSAVREVHGRSPKNWSIGTVATVFPELDQYGETRRGLEDAVLAIEAAINLIRERQRLSSVVQSAHLNAEGRRLARARDLARETATGASGASVAPVTL